MKDQMLHQIIDELHEDYFPVTDEEIISETPESAVFTRTFRHKSGTHHALEWTVFFGTPETVRTEFNLITEKGYDL